MARRTPTSLSTDHPIAAPRLRAAGQVVVEMPVGCRLTRDDFRQVFAASKGSISLATIHSATRIACAAAIHQLSAWSLGLAIAFDRGDRLHRRASIVAITLQR